MALAPKVIDNPARGYINVMKIPTIALMLIGGLAVAQTPANPKVLGTPVSAISIELFSDFQCPGCKAIHENVLRPLIKDYVRTGRAYLVQRDYPLAMHAYSKTAACYACAAERVGKYEQVCDVLFAKQADWGKSGKVEETVCGVLTPAEAAKVRALANTPEIAAEVQADMLVGKDKGINGTPTMLISYNGKQYPVGVVSYPMLQKFLDSLR
jgi:protein-disulfide isomerase